MTDYYSAINVPTDTAGFVELINSDLNYYVGPRGTVDGDGLSVGGAFSSMGLAFAAIKNKRIGKGNTVFINILAEAGMTGWDQHTISESMIEVSHPNADRITIRGVSTPESFEPLGINYYDATSRAMSDSATGGYLLEIIAPDGSLNNYHVGDFVSIVDNNYYDTTSQYVSGVSGPTFIETDFNNYESGFTSGLDISGNSYDASPLSLRKTLLLGCHEVVGVDYTNGLAAQNLLLHVRHTNPTYTNVADGVGGTTAGTAYITPQSLRFADGVFLTDTHAGKVEGTDYNFVYDGASGVTQSRLFGVNLPSNTTNHGASGNYGGFTSSNPLIAQDAMIGGSSGGNGYHWDRSPLQGGGVSGPYRGLTVKRIPYRVHFNSTSGLKITGKPLGAIQDVVFCGPNFTLGATSSIPTDGTIGVWANYNGGVLSTSNFGVVGFDSGVRADNNSAVNVSGTITSNCRYGFVANQNAHLRARNSIASGCDIGYYAINQSHIDADYSISVGNVSDGYYVSNNSSLAAPYSLSCLNGGYGYAAVDSSTLRLTKPESVRGDTVTTLYGPTADARYGLSDKSGAFGFRNGKAGVYAESSTVYADNTRMSYNAESGYYLNQGSYANIRYGNSYYNGFGSGNGAANEWTGSGFANVDASKSRIGGSHSYFSYANGVYALNHSYIHHDGGTSDNNQRNAFKATYDSTILLSSDSYGGTAAGVSGAPGGELGTGTEATFGYGGFASKDSIIFTGTGFLQNGGSADAPTNGVVRTY